MTDDKKPDGWVAWHPTEGLCYGRFIWLTFDDVLEELREDYDLEESYMAFCRENLDDPRSQSFVLWLADQGWRIRPVKLVYLDEEK